jgi:uncharacterized protein YdhG (YjbR/CyaY superfamily)
MADRKVAKRGTPKSDPLFTDEERAAMKERARESKARSRGRNVDGEQEVLEKIAGMQGSDRDMAQRLHAIIRATAPALTPRTWYGMPAYARDGQVICFFRDAQKFKTRYATIGFSDEAHIDEGQMWPTDFALTSLGDAEEAKIAALLRKALS